MENIRVIARDDKHIEVIADSKRFGKDEIMFQAGSFRECFDYIKRETGREKLWLTGIFASCIEDWTGEIQPSFLFVS